MRRSGWACKTGTKILPIQHTICRFINYLYVYNVQYSQCYSEVDPNLSIHATEQCFLKCLTQLSNYPFSQTYRKQHNNRNLLFYTSISAAAVPNASLICKQAITNYIIPSICPNYSQFKNYYYRMIHTYIIMLNHLYSIGIHVAAFHTNVYLISA